MILDYFSGKLSAQEFIVSARQNCEIPLWFQPIIPAEATYIDCPYIPYHLDDQGHGVYQRAASSHPFWKDVQYGCCLNVLSNRIDMGGVYEMHNESVFSCRCAAPSKFGKIASLILYPGIGLIAGLVGIYLCINLSLSEDMLQQRGIFLPAIIVAFSISVFMLWLSTICYKFETKKCIIHKNGITIVGRKEIFY